MPMLAGTITADTFRADVRRIHEAVFAATDDRVFVVPRPVLELLRRADVKVPAVGATFDQGELSQKMSSAGLTIEERAQCKMALAHCGLLKP